MIDDIGPDPGFEISSPGPKRKAEQPAKPRRSPQRVRQSLEFDVAEGSARTVASLPTKTIERCLTQADQLKAAINQSLEKSGGVKPQCAVSIEVQQPTTSTHG